MRRYLAFVLCAVLLFSGCGPSKPSSAPAIATTSVSQPSTAVVAWMSDTQYYSKDYPDIFRSMTAWLAEQQPAAVLHTGDVVHNMEDAEQWKTAVGALSLLENRMPLLIAAGNHDVGHSALSYTAFTTHLRPFFTPSQYVYGRGCYEQITVGKREYLLLVIGYGVDDPAVDWLNSVATAHPQATVILATHSYLHVDGSRTTEGERLYQNVVVPNANIRLVLCGHYHGISQRTDELDDNGDGLPDRTVYQLLADYQAEPKGGGGYLRLLHLSEDGQVQVSTYSPYDHKTNYFSDGDSFTLQL